MSSQQGQTLARKSLSCTLAHLPYIFIHMKWNVTLCTISAQTSHLKCQKWFLARFFSFTALAPLDFHSLSSWSVSEGLFVRRDWGEIEVIHCFSHCAHFIQLFRSKAEASFSPFSLFTARQACTCTVQAYMYKKTHSHATFFNHSCASVLHLSTCAHIHEWENTSTHTCTNTDACPHMHTRTDTHSHTHTHTHTLTLMV